MEQQQLKTVIDKITASPLIHAKWLNSLSMMENTGARKISHYEHPVHTDIIVLKHAAEEARHAYYLKKLIAKVVPNACPDYSFQYLLAPVESHHYLHRLDTQACRYLKANLGLTGRAMKHGAYLLVTYAIEVRADMLYETYQEVLTAIKSRVNVKSIIKEEEGHLAEMTRMLQAFHPQWESLANDAVQIESALFTAWMRAVEQEMSN
ncbi:MAG: hypothetical protein P4L41_05950 [Flavipsychrobacter sp.]|nr:hypothetical protein [Flavipsychrobacter sp.]